MTITSFSQKTKALLLVGAVVAGIYFARGFYYLAVSTGLGASDLRYRQTELYYFFQGQNPYEVFLANSLPHSKTQWDFNGRNTTVNPAVGVGDINALPGYPPWAYPVIAAVAWPPWPAVRYYFAFLNILALAAIAWSVTKLYPPQRTEEAWLVATAVLLTGSFCMTLGVGQLGILVMAGLFLSLVFEARNRPVAAGLWLTLGLIKPTMGLPFLVPFLVKGRWKTLATTATAVTVLWTLTVFITKTPPFTLVQEWLTASSGLWNQGDGPIHQAFRLGVPHVAFTVAVAACGGLVIWVLRDQPLLVLFGLISVAARFWTYHRFYDNILLVFLLTAYCHRLAGKLSPKIFWTGFALLAISLWPPARAFNVLTNEFQYLAWVAVGGMLAYYCRALKDW